jgi:hypothetical protein
VAGDRDLRVDRLLLVDRHDPLGEVARAAVATPQPSPSSVSTHHVAGAPVPASSACTSSTKTHEVVEVQRMLPKC